jgi:DNA polymerase-3 subunit delta
MKLSVDAFLKQLTHKPLLPCYWFAGDEALQRQECLEALLAIAAKQDFLVRERVDTMDLDITLLRAALYATSLFAEKKVVELHLAVGKISEELGGLLLKFLEKPPSEVLMIIVSPKLESSTSQTKSFKAFEQRGMIVQTWPISLDQLAEWLSLRLARYGLKTTLNGLKFLAELTEGNLLYASQSVEKLGLIYAGVTVPLALEQIAEVVAPQANFDIFQLNEAFLAGNKIRALKICRSLQATDAEVAMVWGALLKDIRLLLKLANVGERNFSETCQKLGVWEKRKPLYRQALQRGCKNAAMLKAMANIDHLIKNRRLGNPWLALERFLLRYVA